jgi:tRNA pseudouridine38-40 synthase
VRYGVRLIVAYDGTDFAGFAAQRGQRTVQATLAEAAERVCHHAVVMRGASRTDAGVHAEAQVCAFATERELAPKRWALALNRYLPVDVSVHSTEPCDPAYEPRFDAKDKTYRYLFHLGATRNALLRKQSWHLGRLLRRGDSAPDSPDFGAPVLDLAAMREACGRLTGTHDFRAFRSAGDARKSTVRTLLRLELIEGFANSPELLALEARGNAFMLNMVRILAGTLLDVGRGRLTPDDIARLLSSAGERRDAGMTAPACGLTLVAVTLGRVRAPASQPDP